MSLINDALRRASQPQKHNPNMPKLLSPQEPPKKSGSSGGGKGFTFLLLFAFLAGAGYFGWDYWNKHKTTAGSDAATTTGKTTNATAAANTPAESKTNSNPIARAAAALSKMVERNSDQTEPAKPEPAKPAPPVAAAAPKGKPASEIPGMPKVQAIFYRAQGSTAIIAGQTVRVGDDIGGARVVEIKRQSVRMLLNGDMHEVTIK